MRKALLLAIAFVFTLCSWAVAQDRTVTGTVTDSGDGSPLPGVNVIIKGTASGTVTDIDGKYTLKASSEAVLVFSYVGFVAQEVTVGAQGTIDIALAADVQALEEVVVTALGVSRSERSAGYAVQNVSGKSLEQGQEQNIVNSLQGEIAGVQIQGTAGNLGGSSRITIRGVNSFLGNNQPLFVVDGVPIDNASYSSGAQQRGFGGGAYDYGNAASDINPQDVESINVLKGASATALYGNRGANGVILITTKKGKKNKGLGISVNSELTFTSPLALVPIQTLYGGGSINSDTDHGFYEFTDTNGQTYLAPNYAKDGAWGPAYDGTPVRHWDSFDPQSDNYREVRPWEATDNDYHSFFETGQTLSNSVAFTGGNDKGSFRMSYTNLSQEGIMPNSELERNTLSFSGSYDLSDKLKVSTSASFINQAASGRNATGYSNNNPLQGFLQWWQPQLDFERLQNYKMVDGSQQTWNRSAWNNPTPRFFDNPYWVRYENRQQDSRDRIFGKASASYQIAEGLTLLGQASIDNYTFQASEYIASGGVDVDGYSETTRTFNEINLMTTLSYAKRFGDDFSLNAFVGGNLMKQTRNRNTIATVGGLSLPGFPNVSNSADAPDITNFRSEYGINSLYGSVSFGFRDMLFLDVSMRNDWTSTLAEGKNSYLYPGISGAFVFTELPAFQNISFLSFGKLRVGYGVAANDAGVYRLSTTYIPENPNFYGNARYRLPNSRNNPALENEITTEIEAGVNLQFLNGRIGVDFAYYTRETSNQIFDIATSVATGYSSRIINGGSMKNNGIELMINATPIKTADFSWDLSLNYSKINNEVVELSDELEINQYDLGGTWAADLRIAKGQPYMAIYGQDYQRNDDGQILINENGIPLFTDDRVYLGSAMADFTGGVRNTFTFKGLSASVLIDFQSGGALHSTSLQWAKYSGMLEETVALRDGQNIREVGMIIDGVKEDGTPNTTPVDPQGYYQGYWNRAAPNMFDASFVKLREVSLGYTLPDIASLPLKNIRFSIVGRNLAILHSNVPYLDPQMVTGAGNLQGLENAQTPSTRSLGFNISFKL